MAAGHGYGNLGDEAQLGACINRWKRAAPNVRITVLSPNPQYTESIHGIQCEWAPRVVWFRSNTKGPYSDSLRFRWFFRFLRFRLVLTAHAMRLGVPLAFCTPVEARILSLIMDSDLVHFSGGGYLTGMTHSRLWENCLLMRICQILGTPYMLTGQTIGVFKDWRDRRIARWGLKSAIYIGLRDRGISEAALQEIGIAGKQVAPGPDDAYLCPRCERDEVIPFLQSLGLEQGARYAVVNFHDWGQSPEDREAITREFATFCDSVSNKGLRIFLLAMAPSDFEHLERLRSVMKVPSVIVPYTRDFRMARGVIGESSLVLTMKHHPVVFAQSEGVPVIAAAYDAYYGHKNLGALANQGQERFLVKRGIQLGEFQALVDLALANVPSRQFREAAQDQELVPYQTFLKRFNDGSKRP